MGPMPLPTAQPPPAAKSMPTNIQMHPAVAMHAATCKRHSQTALTVEILSNRVERWGHGSRGDSTSGTHHRAATICIAAEWEAEGKARRSVSRDEEAQGNALLIYPRLGQASGG